MRSRSVLDTFTGRALSGPLQDAGVVLRQTTVVTSTWGAWKRAHPETKIVAEDGGIGRTYEDDPLRVGTTTGRSFPIGDTDPRLPVQVEVVGVIDPEAGPVAFPADRARATLASGEGVVLAGVELFADGGGGFRARSSGGEKLPARTRPSGSPGVSSIPTPRSGRAARSTGAASSRADELVADFAHGQ